MKAGLQTTWLDHALRNVLLLMAVATITLPIIGMVLPLLSIPLLSDVGTAHIFSFSARQLKLLASSVLFSALVAVCTSVIGTLLAAILIRSKSGKKILAIILPPLIIIPPAIAGINWTATILSVGQWLNAYSLIDVQPGGWFIAGLAEVLSFLPVAVAVAWAGFAMLDVRLLEAGLIYRPEAAVFAGIAVRLALPVVLCATGVMFLLSLSDYCVPSLFSVNVYALEIFSTYSIGRHPAAAVYTAAPLVLIIAAALTAVLRAERHAQAMAASRNTSAPSLEFATRLNSTAAIVLIVYFLLPLTVMAATAAPFSSLADAASGARSEVSVTIAVALSAAVLCVVFGLVLGQALDNKGPVCTLLWVLTSLAFALPAPLVGIGILQIGGPGGAWLEELLPVWACTARFLPIAAFVSFAMRLRTDKGLIEAGRVFARSRFHALVSVALPLMLPGLVISATACFTFSTGELGATLLVAAPGHATLMMRLYNLLHYGASRNVAALCLLLALPALVAGLLLSVILHRATAKNPLEHGNA